MSSFELTGASHVRDPGELETIVPQEGDGSNADAFPKDSAQAMNVTDLRYPGRGTAENPYIVEWDEADPQNPYNWSKRRKWIITSQVLSIYVDLHISEEVAVLGISLFVLGHSLGPLVFAPMSEMYGRRTVFLSTYLAFTLCHLGGALGRNVATLLACRLLSGIFGSPSLTNAGGAIADIWNPRERGIANALHSAAPSLGPVIGPIVGGFVSENPHLGWHFNFWLTFIFSWVILVFGFLATPETYAPVLLRRRANRLCNESGGSIHYVSSYDIHRSVSFFDIMRINLRRPFEPIVLLFALYISIAYAILYAFFSAFPIVFQEHRQFTPGQGGLAFISVGVGVIIGISSTPIQNMIYWRAMRKSDTGRAPPEAHLYGAMVGGALMPLGLFSFAWTTQPFIHWIFPILAGVPFGIGIAQVMQGLTAYLMDTYTIYFASAAAATVVLRSLCAIAFPLFTPAMFRSLGDQWACSVFAFLALACVPILILFWRYGHSIRSESRFAYKETEVYTAASSCTEVPMTQEKRNGDIEQAS